MVENALKIAQTYAKKKLLYFSSEETHTPSLSCKSHWYSAKVKRKSNHSLASAKHHRIMRYWGDEVPVSGCYWLKSCNFLPRAPRCNQRTRITKHDTKSTSTMTITLQVDKLLTGAFEGGRRVGKKGCQRATLAWAGEGSSQAYVIEES